MANIDFVKIFASVQVIVDEVKAAKADGKFSVDEVIALVNDVLKELEKNGVDTGDVAEVIQVFLPIVIWVIKRQG